MLNIYTVALKQDGLNQMKVILLFLLFMPIPKVFAFDWNLHRSITMRALLPLGFSIDALDQIADANNYIDTHESSNHATHVDSESFEAASALMRLRLRKTANYVNNGDMKGARETFGYLTHTLQDFYSHTNYVEFMPGKPIDLLHLTNPKSNVTCSKGGMSNGLTSGHYPDSTTPPHKCSHATLNKDSGDITAEGAKAVNYAEKATAKMYEMLEKEVLSLSIDKQKSLFFLSLFRGGEESDHQQHYIDNYDDVAYMSFDETFKITPFIGMTHFKSTEFDFESSFSTGLKVEEKINERIATGIGLTQSSTIINKGAASEFNYSIYEVDIYGKYYLISELRFQPYVGAGIGYLKSTLKHTRPFDLQINDVESDKSTLNAVMICGVDLKLSRRIGANYEVKYVKAVSSSLYSEAYPQAYQQTLFQYTPDKLAYEIENSSHLIFTMGITVSF